MRIYPQKEYVSSEQWAIYKCDEIYAHIEHLRNISKKKLM